MRTPLVDTDRSGLSQIDSLQLCCIILLAPPYLSISFPTVKALILNMRLFPGGGRANGPCQNVHLALFLLFSKVSPFFRPLSLFRKSVRPTITTFLT